MVCSQIEGKQSRTKTGLRECNGLEVDIRWDGLGWSSDRPKTAAVCWNRTISKGIPEL